MSDENRICIGESERAGLPISAERKMPTEAIDIDVRWVMRGKNSFVLQKWHPETQQWMDVPFVDIS